MAENSKIEWTDHTFNPWMGCTKVSPACTNCYAERDFDHRFQQVEWGPTGTRVVTSAANWRKPLQWNRDAEKEGVRRRVFCASLADVFEDWDGPMLNSKREQLFWPHQGTNADLNQPFVIESHTAGGEKPVEMNDLRKRLFHLIGLTPNLDWLVLTKRPEYVDVMWPRISSGERWSSANVWLGTSIENQEWADKRLPHLHAAKRNELVRTTFVSAEPLVGPVMLQGHANCGAYSHLGGAGIDWVITGGESGPNARPAHSDWYRSLRDQCQSVDVPFHFKQWGEWCPAEQTLCEIAPKLWLDQEGESGYLERHYRFGKKNAGRLLDGKTHDGVPGATVTEIS